MVWKLAVVSASLMEGHITVNLIDLYVMRPSEPVRKSGPGYFESDMGRAYRLAYGLETPDELRVLWFIEEEAAKADPIYGAQIAGHAFVERLGLSQEETDAMLLRLEQKGAIRVTRSARGAIGYRGTAAPLRRLTDVADPCSGRRS